MDYPLDTSIENEVKMMILRMTEQVKQEEYLANLAFNRRWSNKSRIEILEEELNDA